MNSLTIPLKIINGLLRGLHLFRISYWNRDKERLVMLCENTIVSCKYDFVAMKIASVERVYLKTVKQMQEGPFTLPDNSVAS